MRAVEILEVVSTPAAQKLLSELAEGNPDASLSAMRLPPCTESDGGKSDGPAQSVLRN